MRFDIVYADPAWKFRNEKTGGSHQSGSAQKYPVMDLKQIADLPVPAITHPGSLLFLWVPTTMKFTHAPTVALSWGFRHYITTIYWDKQRSGMGFYYRNVMEELLVFSAESVIEELLVFSVSAGSVAPFGCQRQNRIACPPMEHSEKPEEFRRLIEESTGKISSRRCVELFARRKVPGWTPVGNQVTGRHIKEDIRRLAAGEPGMAWP